LLAVPTSSGELGGHTRRHYESRQDWYISLSTSQQQYVRRTCDEYPNQGELCTVDTPLVISWNDGPVAFSTAPGAFAFSGGQPHATDWPTAATPWLALDRDRNGTIDRGEELFGSGTLLSDGSHAANGFVALAALDANHDGVIDAADPGFGSLVLWADADGDRKSSPAELAPASHTILSISLAAHVDARCDDRGNCERERAAITWRDAAGATHVGSIIDVYLF
jgi:hypothetical protein